jgi:phosphopantothenoylcysteine decarboxylase/phosphopantothenate--cysteine ligase
MRIIVTAGPTREYIDTVRFITNASSGRMGCAVAAVAARAGHDVTLLVGKAASGFAESLPKDCRIVSFDAVDDLKTALDERFESCDALVMAAAVGDFRPAHRYPAKLPRSGGPVAIRLIPTDDILAGLAGKKRKGQVIIAFAVEDVAAGASPGEAQGQAEAKARAEMAVKGADYVVVNTPAAMAAPESLACILSSAGVVLPWARRRKEELAQEIVKLLGKK